MKVEELKQYILDYRERENSDSYYLFLKEIEGYIKKVLFYKISNPELLEDTAQEIILGIHKSLHTYDLQKDLTPWINSIIFHKVIDFYRKQKKVSSWDNIDDKSINDEKMIMEDRIVVTEVLERLSSEVFGSKFLELKLMGVSIEEIAKELNLTKSNTKVSMHRMAKKIKKGFLWLMTC